MGKLDQLRRKNSAFVAESMGAGVPLDLPSPAAPPPPAPARLRGVSRSREAAVIPLDRIVRDESQPREEFDPEALARLAESLKARGQLQPIRVRWDEGREAYVILVGERRWRAARMAGLETLACVIDDGEMTPEGRLVVQLVENALREDLQPIEQARAYRALMDANGWSTHQVARELAIAQPNVVRALALLELPGEVQQKVERGDLAPGTAYEVAKLADPAEQAALAARAVELKLTRAEVIEAVRGRPASSPRAKKAGTGKGPSRARKVTSRTFRTGDGHKVTVEHRRGVDTPGIAAALREALGQVEDGAREAV